MNMTVNRVASIDIARALIMLIMIFVNGLAELTDVPAWLLHTDAEVDGMGLADVVLPAFLMMMGFSIPYAINIRIQKSESNFQIAIHILKRSAALVIMGLFMVNYLSIDKQSLPMSSHHWQLLMFLSFFLVWNNYPKNKILGLIPSQWLKILGLGVLLILAAAYEGQGDNWMSTHWWGILGLLGLSYGLCALPYFYLARHTLAIATLCGLFLLLNANEFVGNFNIRIVISASNYFLVALGILCGMLLMNAQSANRYMAMMCVIAVGLIVFGFISRPLWEISKIRATPSWATICGGLSMLFYILIYWICDQKGWVDWAKPIQAAGQATLTCYILSFFAISLAYLAGFYYPESLTSGYLGMVRALAYSVLVIQLAYWLGRIGISLKV